ncbi:hypothetical protein Tco_1089947 [Tanacetum coccineum]|uniref:Uncharacterized protein n=1 Tax=Tanacetum coccineum TaxID=301880 RepID=A0ABQ5I3P4_9ASTR
MEGMQFDYRILDSNLDNALKPLSSDYYVTDMAKYVSKSSGSNVSKTNCTRKDKASGPNDSKKPDDVEVDMADFRKYTDENVEWVSVVQRRELHLTRNDKIKVRAKCRGVVLVFSNVKEQGMMGHVTTQDYIILTYVGVDPYNGTYPLAYAVVESETKESWIWFMDLP